jgi:NAD(P)H-dependent flavin oxidoreductase YrpB (nitropropane dioxygenase family)
LQSVCAFVLLVCQAGLHVSHTIAGYETQEQFEHQLQIAEDRLAHTYSQGSALSHVGVGLLGWMLVEPGSNKPDLIRLAISRGVENIWLSFGEPHVLEQFVKEVRAMNQSSEVHIWLVVSTIEEAKRAIVDLGVDVIVAQGGW